MPSGKIHSFTTIAFAGVSAAALHQITGDPETIIAFTSGTLAGLMLTPDLDVPLGSASQSFVRNRIGLLGGLVWRIWWFPYALLIPHRHWVSHFPGISTIIRVIYFTCLIGLIIFLVSLIPGYGHVIPTVYEQVKEFVLTPLCIIAFSGLTLSDIGHYLLDEYF